MALTEQDRLLLGALEGGLPLAPRPYAEVAEAAGLTEEQAIVRLRDLLGRGVVKRLGLVVRHRELGYRANAMVVWDVPDEVVDDIGRRMAAVPYVTLCYQRPRRPPAWPYNLFCMIHGRDRDAVEALVRTLAEETGLADAPREILFSRRCFKQRGARYAAAGATASGDRR